MKQSPKIASDAFVSPDATVGDGTVIWGACQIHSQVKIGEDCSLGRGVNLSKGVEIGDGCRLQNSAQLFEGVKLGTDVFVGPMVCFTNVRYPRAFLRGKFETTLVGRGASLGASATVRCGISLGEFSMLGAGSVLCRDTPAFALFAGNPAVQLGWLSHLGERLNFVDNKAQCPRNGWRYTLQDGLVVFEEAIDIDEWLLHCRSERQAPSAL